MAHYLLIRKRETNHHTHIYEKGDTSSRRQIPEESIVIIGDDTSVHVTFLKAFQWDKT
jgi:hypothetical protein